MEKEINVLEETKDVVTNVVETSNIVGPIIEHKSSKLAWGVFGTVVVAIGTGVAVGIYKKVKKNKVKVVDDVDIYEVDDVVDEDIDNED